ncbi:precorrin-6Y C5,15-methyltransferase (decarboxylating) subunit CbiT [Thermogymnomonas acidicola]|uniref:precorrin-6Y C5,15-methyltransferase (decarboxylating) subunit CbiT n=1 Tax=Thermogymnomonas acidicola TaxID=399579 RepID=UPI00166F13CD
MDWVVPGIPDEMFERVEKIPMTKEEIRAITISKARLRSGWKVLDIGCGSGSITVEAARLVGDGGKVTGVDRSHDACQLTLRNLERFGVSARAEVVEADAVDYLSRGERFNAIIVGGASEEIEEVISLARRCLLPGGTLVLNAIMLETCTRAVASMRASGFEGVECTEVIVARGMYASQGTAMIARNPVFVISCRVGE